jgi:integrase
VFCLEDGTGLDPDWVSQEFARRLEATGARYIRPHDLRHGHATLLLAQGVPIEVVSKRLGHSRISTTHDLYVRPDEDAQRGAADA